MASSKITKSITRTLYTSRHYSRFLSSASSSSSPSITHPLPLPAVGYSPQPSFFLSHSLLPKNPNFLKPFSLSSVRFRVNRAGNSPYTPGSGDRVPTEMAPLFPGCDYEHWLIVMDKPGGEGANKQQMIDCYIQTLSKVLGSEEEAKKKIYNVSCERYFGFGCEVDEETANKMEGLPGVLFVLPDSYVDPEYKDYGAELFVNGEIVQRSPERQRRVEPVPQRNDRIRPNRYNRRRDNMR
ncbi:multiple organellar RNA editing factor 2, chloroplastic-like [Nicotiana sylvestris]|uniref:DAG protein, chloroplastic-like n=1 Tax=Nicotiana sylvestris TaxID=4096 RepID=A0A1U7YJ99_NICSY|nr:PREDICTED: DAG protein, chloroplastic-like [Nicotiana sylvestris]